MSSFFSLSLSFNLSFLLSFSHIVTAGMVTTLAGSGMRGFIDGQGPKASFYQPNGICINQRDGCLYVCEEKNNAIRRVSMQGIHTLEHSLHFFLPIDLPRHLQVMLLLSCTGINWKWDSCFLGKL